MKAKRTLVFLLVVALACTALAGCGEKKEEASAVLGELQYTEGYPIQTDKTLTYYKRLGSVITEVLADFNEAPLAKELIERTGINVEFTHPPVGQEAEDFNLLLASNDFPDIIETNWFFNNAGPAKLIEDKVILPLNDIFDKAAPNLKALMSKWDESKLRQYRAQGNYYAFPGITEGNLGAAYYGVMARKDLLDKHGLGVPETIDEWETALTAFKEDVQYPLQMRLIPSYIEASSDVLVGAYGVSAGYYVDGDTIKYGPAEPGYRQWVEMMRDWYAKGLISKDFATVDAKTISANYLNAEVGMTIGSNGSDFGSWIPILAKSHPDIELVPVPYPSLEKGKVAEFGQKTVFFEGAGAAISTHCQDVELAARLLDYAYSKEGGLLYTLGIEGETYEVVGENQYKFLPMITDSENISGQSFSQAIAPYYDGRCYCFEAAYDTYMAEFYTNPINLAAARLWGTTKAELHKLPKLTFNSADSDRVSMLKTDITTYVDENIVAFITGAASMDNYDAYLAGLESMGVKDVIAIYQAAYDEYLKN
ncbi:MAG: extracellular solute-binding protein [Ruminococcaceae bacterium]|nr:extracellular solute-binding protein [Oscillospiraceae bacterium]